eukprot:g17176.t1
MDMVTNTPAATGRKDEDDKDKLRKESLLLAIGHYSIRKFPINARQLLLTKGAYGSFDAIAKSIVAKGDPFFRPLLDDLASAIEDGFAPLCKALLQLQNDHSKRPKAEWMWKKTAAVAAILQFFRRVANHAHADSGAAVKMISHVTAGTNANGLGRGGAGGKEIEKKWKDKILEPLLRKCERAYFKRCNGPGGVVAGAARPVVTGTTLEMLEADASFLRLLDKVAFLFERRNKALADAEQARGRKSGNAAPVRGGLMDLDKRQKAVELIIVGFRQWQSRRKVRK